MIDDIIKKIAQAYKKDEPRSVRPSNTSNKSTAPAKDSVTISSKAVSRPTSLKPHPDISSRPAKRYVPCASRKSAYLPSNTGYDPHDDYDYGDEYSNDKSRDKSHGRNRGKSHSNSHDDVLGSLLKKRDKLIKTVSSEFTKLAKDILSPSFSSLLSSSTKSSSSTPAPLSSSSSSSSSSSRSPSAQYDKDKESLERLSKERIRLSECRKEKKGRVKAIIAFDTTESMGIYRDQIRKELNYLVRGLDEMLDHYDIAFMGCGDHCDGQDWLQVNDYSHDQNILLKQINWIKDTAGGDEPEAYECFFRWLNDEFALTSDTTLILIGDSLPHNMNGYSGLDSGCPYNVDYRRELRMLKSRIKGFYMISCNPISQINNLQKELVDHDKYLVRIKTTENLPNIIMGMCMSEVDRLDYMMGVMEEVRRRNL